MVDIAFILGDKRVEKQVPANTRISSLKAMISRNLGISIRKRRIIAVEGEGERSVEIGEGDGAKDIGWFISGKRGVLNIE
jgi:hypothetical protein